MIPFVEGDGKRKSPPKINQSRRIRGDVVGLTGAKPSPNYYPTLARDSQGGDGWAGANSSTLPHFLSHTSNQLDPAPAASNLRPDFQWS
jgi:hypothetical protein